jgi:hypothetical protein
LAFLLKNTQICLKGGTATDWTFNIHRE